MARLPKEVQERWNQARERIERLESLVAELVELRNHAIRVIEQLDPPTRIAGNLIHDFRNHVIQQGVGHLPTLKKRKKSRNKRSGQ